MKDTFLEIKFWIDTLKKHNKLNLSKDDYLYTAIKSKIRTLRKTIRGKEQVSYPNFLSKIIEQRDVHEFIREGLWDNSFWIGGTLSFRLHRFYDKTHVTYTLDREFQKLIDLNKTSIRNQKVIQSKEIHHKDCPNDVRLFRVSCLTQSWTSVRTKYLAIRGDIISLTGDIDKTIRQIDKNTASHVMRKLQNG